MTLDNYYYKQILPDANNPPIYLVGLSHTFLVNLLVLGLLFFVYASVWGWNEVLKFNVVFNPLNRDLQKLPVNLGSQSEIITFGIPCSQKICFKKISAMFASLYVIFTGIKWDALLNLSTTTIIESFKFWFLGSPVTKSRLIISHFQLGMGNGWSNPAGCWCSILTYWHSKHLAIYYASSIFIFGQKYSFLNKVIVFW